MTKFFEELIPYIVVIILVVIIRTFIITPVRVDGTSMSPTLSDTEILIEKKFDKSYKRFEIVIFRHNKNKLVKRVIGLPGETLEVKDNKLYINGEYVEETFDHKVTEDYKYKEGKIPEGTYFVMGDNRLNSLDSRIIGPISKEDIEGTVNLSVFPPKIIK